MLLPPSLGDPMLASNGKSLLDDLSPEMSQVSYTVRATVLRKSAAQAGSPKTLGAVAKKVRVAPAFSEEPPLNIFIGMSEPASDESYCLRREKDVRRGLMRGLLGKLTVAALQPRPIQLVPPACDSRDAIGTVATLHLRFDPAAESELPPRLDTVSSRLRVATFFSTHGWPDYPSNISSMTRASMGKDVYTETLALSSLHVASATWTKHVALSSSFYSSSLPSVGRPDSMLSINSLLSTGSTTATISSTASASTAKSYYTASVVVPLTLPVSKAFVPTFHSCLISRTYTLLLSVSYTTPNANLTTPSVLLKVPLQITARRSRTRSEARAEKVGTSPIAVYASESGPEAADGSGTGEDTANSDTRRRPLETAESSAPLCSGQDSSIHCPGNATTEPASSPPAYCVMAVARHAQAQSSSPETV